MDCNIPNELLKIKDAYLNFDIPTIKQFFQDHNLEYSPFGYISSKPYHNIWYGHYYSPDNKIKINIQIDIQGADN